MIISIWIQVGSFPSGQYVTPTANLRIWEGAEKKSKESLRLCLLSRYRSENLCLSFSYIMGVTYFAVQSLSHVWLFATPCTVACQSSLSFTISQSLLKLMSIELVMPSRHLILCHPLLLSSVFPRIRVFSNELSQHKWPKYWSFSISPSNEYSGFIFFTALISLQSKGLSRVSSNTTVRKHQFFGIQPSLWSNSYICTQLL